ncbi:MAG: hypothetical protein IKC80_02790 [Kiritimatiellae bacterium]|nr:hypothetical protein [Kiritimatiellia bacterium]
MFTAGAFLLSAALVVNGGFEDDIKGWNFDRKNFEVVSGAGISGSRGFVWTNSNPSKLVIARRKLELEPGRAYRFECWVKNDGLVNAKTKPGDKPTVVSIELYDDKGKFICMTGARAVVDNQKSEAGWTRYRGTTPITPSNLGEALFLFYAAKGTTGTQVLDCVEVTALKEVPIASVFSSAYRDTAYTGKVSFAAKCVLNPCRYSLSSVKAFFRFAGVDGAMMVPVEINGNGYVRTEVDVSDLARGTHGVEIVLKRGDGSLIASRKMDFTRVDRRPSRKVDFDKYGRAIVDGRAFFPIGLYSSRSMVERLDIYCQGPFNCILPYGLSPDYRELDPYHAKGIKVIVSVHTDYIDYIARKGAKITTREDEHAFAERYLKAIKDHPALLAWYIADELPPDKIENLRERNLLFRAGDPDHPTLAVFDRVDSPADFIEGYDIVAMDPYPIGNAGGRASIANASIYPEAARAGMWDFRMLWQVPQTFDWTWYRPWAAKDHGARMPTFEEMRNMNWQAVASGANGLIGWWFAGIVKHLEGKGKTQEFNKVWEDVKKAYAEVAEKTPLLLSVEQAPRVSKLPPDISARTWRKDGILWLLAVNRTYKPVSGVIALSDGSTVDVSLEGLGVVFTKIQERGSQRKDSAASM